MSEKRPPIIIDMTPEGEFRDQPPPPAPRGFEGFLSRVGNAAFLLALSGFGLLMAAFAVLAIGVLLPVVLIAGAIGAITIWWRLRKARARGESTIIVTHIDRRDG